MNPTSEAETTVAKMQRLFDLWGKFDRVYFRILQQWKLSYNTYLVLEELLQQPGGLEPAALADRLNIPRQTMTFVLDGLERTGMLERLAHPADRRRKLAQLNDSGVEFAHTVCDTIFEREYRAMNSLSPEEQEILLTLYGKLQVAFEREFSSSDLPEAASL